jgi:hypothetical protein
MIAILPRCDYVGKWHRHLELEMDTLRLAEKWEQAGVPQGQARAMVNALAEEMKDEIATKEFVRAELANLRYQMLAAHLASFIGLALLILFRT